MMTLHLGDTVICVILKLEKRQGQRLGEWGAPLLLCTRVRKVKFQCVWGAGRPVERQGVVITEGGDGAVRPSWVLSASHISSRWGRNSL